MAISGEEIINAQFFLAGVNLVPTEVDVEVLRRELGADVVPTGGLGELNQVTVVHIPKHRIRIDSAVVGTAITREYPSGPDDLDWIVRIYSTLKESKVGEIVTYEFNFAYTYEQESTSPAGSYIAERVLNRDSIRRLSGRNVEAGSARFSLEQTEGNRWTVVLEPRNGDPNSPRVFLSLNVRYQLQPAPSPDDLRIRLANGLNDLRQFAVALDGLKAAGI